MRRLLPGMLKREARSIFHVTPPHRTEALRLSARILAAVLISSPVSAADTLTPPSGRAAASQSPTAVNPLLAQIQRIPPQELPLVLTKLESLASPAGGSRGGDTRPTEAEATQLGSNPAFMRAYRQSPADTLALLRFLNQEIRSQ